MVGLVTGTAISLALGLHHVSHAWTALHRGTAPPPHFGREPARCIGCDTAGGWSGHAQVWCSPAVMISQDGTSTALSMRSCSELCYTDTPSAAQHVALLPPGHSSTAFASYTMRPEDTAAQRWGEAQKVLAQESGSCWQQTGSGACPLKTRGWKRDRHTNTGWAYTDPCMPEAHAAHSTTICTPRGRYRLRTVTSAPVQVQRHVRCQTGCGADAASSCCMQSQARHHPVSVPAICQCQARNSSRASARAAVCPAHDMQPATACKPTQAGHDPW